MALEFKWLIIIVFNELGSEIAFFRDGVGARPRILLYLVKVEYLKRQTRDWIAAPA